MNDRGFTLLEVLVVAGITVMITSMLIVNFSRSRVDLNQTVIQVTDGIREAQALALSGTTVSVGGADVHPCGYGIHFEPDGFTIYAGPDAEQVACAAEDRDYDADEDTVVREAFFSNVSLEIAGSPADVFFEPPDPTTYIGNSRAPGEKQAVIVRVKGASCASGSTAECRTITVTTAGLIQTQ